MEKVQLKIKLFPGEQCWVENYRSKSKPWERGEVISVDASIRKGSSHVSYRVMIHRKSASGSFLFVTVGDKAIKQF